MKKNLPLIIVFLLIVVSALHRGGISFQTHLLWTITLLPIFIGIMISRKDTLESKIPTPLLAGILLFLLSIVAGWLMSSMRDFGLITMTTLVSGAITMLLMAQIEGEEPNIHRFFTGLSVFTAGLCAFGVILYIATPADRLASTFAQLPYIITAYPNAFALFLIGIMPYALLQFSKAYTDQKSAYNRKEKAAWFSITTLMLVALLLTFSRGGIIVGGLLILFLVVKKILRIQKPLIALMLIALVGILIIQGLRATQFETNRFAEKITLQADEKTSSVDERISFWKGSIRLILDRPLWGFGPDTFGFAFPHYQSQPLANSGHPHNIFLKHAVDFGIPSTVLYILLIGSILILGIRSSKNNEIMTILLLSTGGILMHNMIDYNLNFTSNAALLWVELGLIINLAMRDRVLPSTLMTPRRILVSLMALMVTGSFMIGGYEIYQRKKIVEGRTLTTAGQYDKAATVFASAHPIFFEDAILLEGNNAIESNNMDLANKLFWTIANRDTLYAEALNAWTEVLMKNNNYKAAEQINRRSLELDRFNRLRYHLNFMRILQKNGVQITDSLTKGYVTMLEVYLTLLKSNSHNTVSTDDPSSAIKLTHILETITESPIQRMKLQGLRRKVIEAAQEERKKFFNMFSIPLNPL